MDIQRATAALLSNHPSEALQILAEAARQGADRYETLFLAAQAYAALGDLRKAIRYYDAILADKPEAVRVRLDLARTLFLLGDDDRAERQFRLTLAGSLPDVAVKRVYAYLDAIRQRRRWAGNVGVALAPDSNVNQAPTTSEVVLYNRPFTLDDNAKSRSGLGVIVNLDGRVDLPVRPDILIRSTGLLYRAEYGGNDFDDTIVQATLGPRLLRGPDTWTLGALVARRWYGGPFSYAAGGQLSWERWLTRRFGLEVQVNGRYTWHDTYDYLNGPSFGLSMQPTYTLTSWSFVSGNLAVEREQTSDQFERNTLLLGGVGLYVELPKGFTIWVGPAVGYRFFDEENAAFGNARNDWTLSGNLTVANRWFQLWGFYPTITGIAETRESNQDLYDYQRLRMEVGVRRQF